MYVHTVIQPPSPSHLPFLQTHILFRTPYTLGPQIPPRPIYIHLQPNRTPHPIQPQPQPTPSITINTPPNPPYNPQTTQSSPSHTTPHHPQNPPKSSTQHPPPSPPLQTPPPQNTFFRTRSNHVLSTPKSSTPTTYHSNSDELPNRAPQAPISPRSSPSRVNICLFYPLFFFPK